VESSNKSLSLQCGKVKLITCILLALSYQFCLEVVEALYGFESVSWCFGWSFHGCLEVVLWPIFRVTSGLFQVCCGVILWRFEGCHMVAVMGGRGFCWFEGCFWVCFRLERLRNGLL
jgi:hypothetical protein